MNDKRIQFDGCVLTLARVRDCQNINLTKIEDLKIVNYYLNLNMCPMCMGSIARPVRYDGAVCFQCRLNYDTACAGNEGMFIHCMGSDEWVAAKQDVDRLDNPPNEPLEQYMDRLNYLDMNPQRIATGGL